MPEPNPNAIELAKLPSAKRESNRDFVRTIPRKLHRVGLRLVKTNSAEATEETIRLLEEKLEELAKIEHVRWNWQSILQGYVYKPGQKNDQLRTNPSIVPWEKLPEDIRDFDRNNSKLLPELIHAAGFDVVPV